MEQQLEKTAINFGVSYILKKTPEKIMKVILPLIPVVIAASTYVAQNPTLFPGKVYSFVVGGIGAAIILGLHCFAEKEGLDTNTGIVNSDKPQGPPPAP